MPDLHLAAELLLGPCWRGREILPVIYDGLFLNARRFFEENNSTTK
jgi:hypothetical protein